MDTNQITPFNFHGATVRVLTDAHGETWFVGKDVAEVLGYANTRDALNKHVDEDDKNSVAIRDGKGNPNQTMINESGLYSLVLSSKLPSAREFKRWVTSEVLPSIRKHGGYIAGQEQMSPEQMVLASIKFLESKISEQQAQLEAQAPKVLFADAVAASDGTCLVGELAKMLTQAGYKTGQNRLFKQLREDGYLGKSGQNRNVPLQRYVDCGLFRIKETAVTHADGHVTLNRTPKVTGKGQTYFLDKYAHHKESLS